MMLNMKFFNVYYFCHLANISVGTHDYSPKYGDFVDGQYSDNALVEDFPRISVLRDYCFWLVEDVIAEQADLMAQDLSYDFNPFEWIVQAICKYRDIHISYDEWQKKYIFPKDCNDYLDIFYQFTEFLNEENDNIYDAVIECIALEIEHILFQNREFLFKLNETIASVFENESRPRVYIPEWVKRSVLFRDKGCCVFCKKDLTGLYTLLEDNQKQFDHIVPLANGGINDVCNIQLVCQQCNLRKKAISSTNTSYQSVY